MAYQAKTVKTQFRYMGVPVDVINVSREDGNLMGLKDIERIINEYSCLEDDDTCFKVTIEYDDIGWKSLMPFTVRDFYDGRLPSILEAPMYEMSDFTNGDDAVKSISIIMLPAPVLHGGCRSADNSRAAPGLGQNDCLFRALQIAFGSRIPCFKSIACKSEEFRAAINQPGNNKIPASIEVFDRINSMVGNLVKVNCTGEFIYNSPKQCHRTVTIKLFNEHYTLVQQTGRNESHAIARSTDCGDEKLRLARFNEDKTVTLIDMHDNEETISRKDYMKYKYSPFQSPYIIISKYQSFSDYFAEKAGMDTLCNNFNCYISIKNYCLELFRVTSQTIPAAPALTPIEEHWIGHRDSNGFAALRGGIIYHQNGTFNDCYAYDVVSMYPSIMDSLCFVPNGLPQECIMTEFPEFLKMGLYRMKITVPQNMLKLWRGGSQRSAVDPQEGHIYTQVDYQIARMLGASFEWPDDDQPNALIYDKADQIRFADMFHPFVHKLFALKKTGSKPAKAVLNMLWGALNERNYKKHLVDASAKPRDIDGEIMASLTYSNSNLTFIKVRENNKPLFKGSYPRVGVWLTAQARLKMVKLLLPHIDKIRRIHTDGFILQGVSNLKTGADLGDLKLEKHGVCIIEGMRKPTWTN
jgi:hypothetical protein